MNKWKIVAAALLLLAGCEPKPSTPDLVKNLVVLTDYDKTKDFKSYTKYYLNLDTIKYFNPSSGYYPNDTLQCTSCQGYNAYFEDYPTQITGEIKSKMDFAGYTQVNTQKTADLLVYVFVVENYSVSQSYSYNPYGGYYGGYGYGYGGYYPTVTVSDQADLYIEIFDLTKSTPTLIWYCDISDLVSSPDYYDLSIAAVDKAFTQSTYIKKN